MSHLIPNTFSTYHLTEEETLQGSVLSFTQRQVMQNRLAVVAEEKLGLEFDTAKPESFIQQEAYKKGQVELYQWLLDESDTAVAALNGQNDPDIPE